MSQRARSSGRKAATATLAGFFKNHLPEPFRLSIPVYFPFFEAQHAPASGEKCLHRILVEEALGFPIDGEVTRLDLGMAAGAVVMVVGRVEAAEQDSARRKQVPDTAREVQRH